MDHLKQLDDVLKFLHDDHLSSIVYSKIMMNFRHLPKDHLYLILDRLCKDEYIIKKGKDSEWSITYDGVIFLRHGGYVQEVKDINAVRDRNDRHNKIIRGAAVLAAIYASVQILTSAYELLKGCSCCY